MAPRRSARHARQKLASDLRTRGWSWVDIGAALRRQWPELTALASIRMAHGWTQQAVADQWMSRWPESTRAAKDISLWENWPAGSGRRPSFEMLDKLAQIYQCSVSDLITDLSDHRHLDTANPSASDHPGSASPLPLPAHCSVNRAAPQVLVAQVGEVVSNAPSPAPDIGPHLWDDPFDVWLGTRQLQSTNIGAVELELYEQRVTEIVDHYEHAGPLLLAAPARQLRAQLHNLLAGHQRLAQRQRLCRIAAQISGLLGYMAINTSQFDHAEAYCAEAFELAVDASDVDLQVWIWGTRSFGAFNNGQWSYAHDCAVAGRALGPTSAQSIRLAVNGEARAAGELGDHRGVTTAVSTAFDLADRFDVPDGLTPCISFEPYGHARVVANAATAYVPLGDSAQVVRYAGDLGPAVDQARSGWSRALIGFDLATANLHHSQPDLDQAVALAIGALDAVTTNPIRSICQRARRFHQLTRPWCESAEILKYDEIYRVWRQSPAVAAIARP